MADTTKPRQFRVPEPLWTAYDNVCQRLGVTRAEDLNAHIRSTVEEHGDDVDRALLAEAEAELAERRARKGGRPPKATSA
ncbi:hypothetical protein [Amycolatopsis sp. NPDC051716]|uniref:hypothetical protein n=1 Tax=Amycolatopsis sp. NPDC051716 TaxID=3155804 RepID=UPI003419A9B1